MSSIILIFLLVKIYGGIQDYIQTHKCGDNLKWKISGNTMTISGKGPMDSDWGWKVHEKRDTIDTIIIKDGCTSIGDLSYYANLTSVSLPNSVTAIDSYAFEGCNNLTQIELPSSLKEIGSYAFSETGLTSLYIPASVEIIEGLGNLDFLTEIFVDENNTYYTVIDGVLYNHDMTTLVGYAGGNFNDSFEVFDGVKSILADSGLWDSDNLILIMLPQSLSECNYGGEVMPDNDECVIYYLGTLEQWRDNQYSKRILWPVVCSDGVYTYEEMMRGTWSSSDNEYSKISLTFREDMTCSYTEENGMSGEGTWYVTDHELRIQTNAVPFELYVDLTGLSVDSDDVADFYLNGDSGDWAGQRLYRFAE